MGSDPRLKEYSQSQNPGREVISDLFLSDRRMQVSALQFIVKNPDPIFEKAIQRKGEGLSDPYVIASYVKAAAAVLGEDALPIIAVYLRHAEARVRANCIEALELSGVDPARKRILSVLMNFLSDPDPRVSGNCIKALSRSLETAELTTLVQDYFDSSDPRRCLNALHLIEQLRLTDALSILQTCLNHEVEQIRIRAQEILPVFQDEIPQARELSLRQRKESKEPLQESAEVQSPRELLKQLVASLRNSDIRETTALLQELAKERENPETAAFLRKLLTNPSLGLDPFILATAVKTLAVCSDQSEYETLSRYLNHADGRVISNTVEALAARDEPSLLPFLEKHLEIMEITDPIQVRVLSSGLEFLRTKKEDLALEAMRKLASGDINSITTFLLHLEKWPDPHQEFQDLVFQILEGEVRLEVTRSCIRHLEVHGDPICVNLLKNLISDLLEGEKRSLLKDLYYFMIEKFGLTAESLPEDHPAQIEPEIKLDETSLQPEKGSPKTVISGLQQRAAMFLNLSTEPSKRALILQIPLGGEKKHKLEIPTKVVKWAGISLGVVFLVGTGSLFLLSSDSSMKNLRGGRNDTSKPVVSKRSSGGTNIKGRGTIQMIDLADGTVRTQGENGEFDVQFENPALLDRFSRGQKVKFVGEFLEKDPADVVQVKGKFLFEDRRLGKKKKS